MKDLSINVDEVCLDFSESIKTEARDIFVLWSQTKQLKTIKQNGVQMISKKK